jgi:hypothetical protein
MGVIIGAVILFTFLSLLFAFLAGIFITKMRDDTDIVWCVASILGLILNVGLSIAAIQVYYEKKEYLPTKYELKKKVIHIEEDNTIKLDTVYKFMCK